MVASFTDWDRDPNYLAHFGIKGMKHGVRRFQNSDGSLTALGRQRYGYTDTGTGGKRAGAHRITKDLNKLDREKTTSAYRMNKYASKIAKKDARYAQKMEAAKAAGNEKKLSKIADKQRALASSRAAKKVKGYSDLINKNEAMTNKIINTAKANGMNIKSKNVKRVVNKGALAAKSVLGLGAAVGGAYGLGKFVTNGNIRAGNIGKPIKINGTTFVPSTAEGFANYQTGIRRGKYVAGGATAALGAAIGATAKKRTGTKYKVKKAKRG